MEGVRGFSPPTVGRFLLLKIRVWIPQKSTLNKNWRHCLTMFPLKKIWAAWPYLPPPPHTHTQEPGVSMLVPDHLNPPPPISGIGSLAPPWVTIGNCKNTPFSGLSREIFPRLWPKYTPFPEKINLWECTACGPSCIRVGGGAAGHALSIFDEVLKWSPEKCTSKHHWVLQQSENTQVTRFTIILISPIYCCVRINYTHIGLTDYDIQS